MDPITSKIALGAAGAGGEDTAWVRAHIRGFNNYINWSPDPDQKFVVQDDDHVYFIYSVRYSPSTPVQMRLEMFKVLKKDGSTVWHRSRNGYSTSPYNGDFYVTGASISPDGNWILCSLFVADTSSTNSNANNIRPSFVEFSTSNGDVRTTAQGALYAGGLQDSWRDRKRGPGILYAPGSSTDFIVNADRQTAYGGFYRITKGSSSYSTPWCVKTYNTAPYNEVTAEFSPTLNMGISYNPTNSNELVYVQRVFNYIFYRLYVGYYDLSTGTPNFSKGFYMNERHDSQRFSLLTYGNDVYMSLREDNGNGPTLYKWSWNGSSWVNGWKITTSNSNGYSYTANTQSITYDSVNNRLLLFETDFTGILLRQINPATGAQVAVRRMVFNAATNDTSLDPSHKVPFQTTTALQQNNTGPYLNQAPIAYNGFVYVGTGAGGAQNAAGNGAFLFKLPTDLSLLPSTKTNFTGSDSHSGFSFAIGSPGSDYSFSTSSSHSLNLSSLSSSGYTNDSGFTSSTSYGAAGANNYVTSDTNRQPSDITHTIV
jgi:hypothetical protein